MLMAERLQAYKQQKALAKQKKEKSMKSGKSLRRDGPVGKSSHSRPAKKVSKTRRSIIVHNTEDLLDNIKERSSKTLALSLKSKDCHIFQQTQCKNYTQQTQFKIEADMKQNKKSNSTKGHRHRGLRSRDQNIIVSSLPVDKIISQKKKKVVLENKTQQQQSHMNASRLDMRENPTIFTVTKVASSKNKQQDMTHGSRTKLTSSNAANQQQKLIVKPKSTSKMAYKNKIAAPSKSPTKKVGRKQSLPSSAAATQQEASNKKLKRKCIANKTKNNRSTNKYRQSLSGRSSVNAKSVKASKHMSKNGKVFKFVRIRVRLHNKHRWRDISTKRAASFAQLKSQLKNSLGDCAALERVSGEASMTPDFYHHEDCMELEQGVEYIVHTAESKRDREQELNRYLSAVTIQATFRGRQKFTIFQKIRRTALFMQVHARRRAAQSFATNKRNAITRLQTQYRSYQNHRRFSQLKEASIVLQKHIRHFRRLSATKSIQAIVRGHCIRTRCRHWNHAATNIQRVFRAKNPRIDFATQRGAAVTLQRAWRTFYLYIYEQQCTGAAIISQQLSRGWLVRRKLKRIERFFGVALLRTRGRVLRRHHNACANVIQNVCRAWLDKRNNAAVNIQRTFRGHQERCVLRGLNGLATCGQAVIRGFLARRHLLKLNQSASSIQAAVRRSIAYRQYQNTLHTALKLQSYTRMFLAKFERWQVKEASVIVHRFMRWQRTAEEASFNRRIFRTKHTLDAREKAREEIKNKIEASAQRKQDEMLDRIRRIEARARAQGIHVRPGDGRRYMEINMFCSPQTTRRRQEPSAQDLDPMTTLTLEEKALINKSDIEKDENLLSCCQTYLNQLRTVMEFKHGDSFDDLQIAYEIKMRAREHIEMIWGTGIQRTQRRRSLY